MDWDKILKTVMGITCKTGILAFALIVVMVAISAVYVVALAVMWGVRHVQAAVGS